MEMLTDRQKQVLKFIEGYQLEHGKSPTIKEIRLYLKVASDNSVLKHIIALEKKGFIAKDDTPRGIKLLEHVRQKLQNNTVSIPLLGFVPAGGPVHSEEHVEDWMTFDSAKIKNPSHTFMLRVTGNSMIDAGIFEGDLILADSKKEPRVNDIVIGLVDGENTVKRLVRKDGQYFLKAENPDYSDIYPVGKLEVQGVVLTLLRNFF
jgi:repressor LexA